MYAAKVLVSPKTILALVDPNKTAQFICEVEGVAQDWYFNGTHEGEESMATSNTTLLNVSESGAAVFIPSLGT